jgi:hypothetical protein
MKEIMNLLIELSEAQRDYRDAKQNQEILAKEYRQARQATIQAKQKFKVAHAAMRTVALKKWNSRRPDDPPPQSRPA